MHHLDLTRRMIKWAAELFEFRIKYESRPTVKAQVLVGFVTKWSYSTQEGRKKVTSTLHVVGSSNNKRSGTSSLLEISEGLMIEVSLTFSFSTTTRWNMEPA